MQFNATAADSRRLARVRSKETRPEILLRKHLWKMGFRNYRKHPPLPGTPDLLFPRRKLVVFVDGCFWHGCPIHFKLPRNNADYWAAKIEGNKQRDQHVQQSLESMNYYVVRLWEHDIKRNMEKVVEEIMRALAR